MGALPSRYLKVGYVNPQNEWNSIHDSMHVSSAIYKVQGSPLTFVLVRKTLRYRLHVCRLSMQRSCKHLCVCGNLKGVHNRRRFDEDEDVLLLCHLFLFPSNHPCGLLGWIRSTVILSKCPNHWSLWWTILSTWVVLKLNDCRMSSFPFFYSPTFRPE